MAITHAYIAGILPALMSAIVDNLPDGERVHLGDLTQFAVVQISRRGSSRSGSSATDDAHTEQIKREVRSNSDLELVRDPRVIRSKSNGTDAHHRKRAN
jgi:hypothetical protein